MNPKTAMTLAGQHRQELAQHAASSKPDLAASAGTGWLRRHLPRWQVSWSRTVLSPAGLPGTAGSSRPGRRGSSLVIIISAHRSA